MEFDFKGKVAVITGAASGMGLLFSKKFVEYGGYIVMTDINPDTLKAAADEVNAIREGSAVSLVCDVRRYEDIKKAADLAFESFGRVDISIPFAGGAEYRMLQPEIKDFPFTPIEVFDWSLDVNLKSQLYLDHAVLPYMREAKSGVVIHIGSVTGEEGSAGNIGYSTAKSGAMNGLTKSVALHGAPYGIRCVCVSPGPVLTRPGMINMKTPLGRAAEPIEIINLIMYLASDYGSFITGQNILIDGGRSIMYSRQG